MIYSPIRSPLSSAIRSVFEPSRGGAPLVFPLDDAGALPLAAYGVKRLTASYSGPAIRIRRADAAEIDIGFSGQSLDAAAVSAHLGTATGTVTTFYDLTGSGRHATQAVVANQAKIDSTLLISGAQSVLMSNAWYDLPVGVETNRRDAEVCAVIEPALSGQQIGLYEIGAVSNANINAFTTNRRWRGTPNGANSTYLIQARPVWLNHIAAVASSSFEQDGQLTTGGAAGSATTASGGFFGKTVAAGYTGPFHFGAIAFYGRVLSAGERASVKSRFSSVLNSNSGAGVLVYEGDSITAASTLDVMYNGWAHQVSPLLNNNPRQYNFAGGGEQLVNDMPGAASQFSVDVGVVFGQFASERKVVFLHKGTNDMSLGGRTPAQVYADMQTYCGVIRSNGGLVIVSTLLPKTGYGLSNSAAFDTLNSDVRANWASFADGFVDYAAHPIMGASGAASDLSLYLDGLHPTIYGNSLLASAAAPEINRVFALP
jgi:hypothetical protein